MGFKPQEPLEQISQRKQCRVLRVLRTPTFPPGMWFIGYGIFQYLHQTGFANAPFTSQEHDLPVTFFDLCPTFQKQRDFRLSTDQGCKSSWLSNIQATGGTTLAQDAVHVDGLSHTSECLFAQVLACKIAMDQAIGRTTDHKRVGRS